MLNNSQGSQGNNDLQTAQNAIAILIDQISKARGVGRTIVIDKNWLNNQLSEAQRQELAAHFAKVDEDLGNDGRRYQGFIEQLEERYRTSPIN